MTLQTVYTNQNTRKPRVLVFYCLCTLLLTACSASTTTSQSPGPEVLTQVDDHPPIVLRAVERQQVVDGYLMYYQDIYFTDPDGDAVALTYTVTSSSLAYPLNFPDTPIEVLAYEQSGEALVTETIGCWQKMELAYEIRIQDRAGNLSEPVLLAVSCTAPQPLDTRPFLISGLSIIIPIGLLLSLGFWLLFRKHPAERLPVLRSILLLFFVFMILRFLQMVFHEGGHALYLLVRGMPATLYVHPFNFNGYARPIYIGSSIWKDILGSVTAVPVGLLISLIFWRRRSLALLPWVMLFPFIALNDGFNIMGFSGDFKNLVQSTGLPATLFMMLGGGILCIGLVSLLSLFPLTGLDRQDNKALFVLPAAMFLVSVASFLVAHLFVPGSPIDLEYFMGREIMTATTPFIFLFFLVFGIVLPVLYVTLFRKLYPRLPAWLHTETVHPTWKDLRLPGILWAVSVIIGLIIVI